MQLLDEIVSLTEELLRRAEASAWEQVRELEPRRADLIGRCFPLDASVTRAEQAAVPITRIIELDQRIMALAAQERQRLGDEIGRLQQGRQATSAYAANAR